MSEIKVGPSPEVPSIEFNEIHIDGSRDANHPFLQRLRREDAERRAAATPRREAFVLPPLPDVDELLKAARWANQAEIIAREQLTAAEDEEALAREELDVARTRLAELEQADDVSFSELTQARQQRLAQHAAARREWLKAGGIGERPEVPAAPVPSLERAALDRARIEVEVCESTLAAASAKAAAAREAVPAAMYRANVAARRALARGIDDIPGRYAAHIEGAAAEWELAQVANMAQFPLNLAGLTLQPLAGEVSPGFKALVSSPPRHVVDIGTEIGGRNSARAAAYREYLQRKFRELRALLPEQEGTEAAAAE
jgi:hypothetical protein